MLAPGPEAPLIHLSSDFIRAKEYLEAIVTSTSDAICTTDVEGLILYFSPGAEAMTGARSVDMIGRPAHASPPSSPRRPRTSRSTAGHS